MSVSVWLNVEASASFNRRARLENIERGISRTVGYVTLLGALGFIINLMI